MRNKDFEKLDHEKINKMTSEELRENISYGVKQIQRRFLGFDTSSGRHYRGIIEQTADRLRKNPMYPIPHAVRTGYDYDKINPVKPLRNVIGLSGNKRREALYENRNIKAENERARIANEQIIQDWIDYQKDRLENRIVRLDDNISSLRHQLVAVRDTLTLKTNTMAGWNDVLENFIKKVEEGLQKYTGTEIHISAKDYAAFLEIWRRLNETYADTNQGERYELWRRIDEAIVNPDYSGKTPEEIAIMIQNDIENQNKGVIDTTDQLTDEERENPFIVGFRSGNKTLS